MVVIDTSSDAKVWKVTGARNSVCRSSCFAVAENSESRGSAVDHRARNRYKPPGLYFIVTHTLPTEPGFGLATDSQLEALAKA